MRTGSAVFYVLSVMNLQILRVSTIFAAVSIAIKNLYTLAFPLRALQQLVVVLFHRS
jgi:hypothetical protein